MDIERDENKVLACCCKPQSDMVIEADVDEDPDFLGHLVQDYQATVIEIKDLSPTIKGIRLQLDRPIEFQAGQYINVQFPDIEGTRAFSIANSPSEVGIVELHIRKVEGGARPLMYMNNLPRVISSIFQALMDNFCTQVR